MRISRDVPTNDLPRAQEVFPTGWTPDPPQPSNDWGLGRVINVLMDGQSHLATVTGTNWPDTHRVTLYLPDTDQYLDVWMEWATQ